MMMMMMMMMRLALHRSRSSQHSCHVQLGHWLGEGLALHSEGRQPQSAHFICIKHTLIIPFEWIFILQLFLQVIAAYPRI
jgi:hypothetical protein